MSDHMRNRIDTKEKVYENNIRRQLGRNGYFLRKSRQHIGIGNKGGYQIICFDGKLVAGPNYELSLLEIEYMLLRGKIFPYGEMKKYLVRLAHRNPWFQKKGGGHEGLVAFYEKHFLNPGLKRQLPPDEVVICKKCKSEQITKSGIINKKQRFRCKICGCNFTIGDNRLRDQFKRKDIVEILYSWK